nr:phage major capsid protein [Bacillus velezensis]
MVLFDRQQQSIASTDVGGAFETNTTKVRAIEREDVKLWDSEAVVYGQLTLSAE